MLRCADGSYYTGHTDNLDVRLAAHRTGALPGWTLTRRPVELVWSEWLGTRDEALSAELRIKGWSRAKKEALIRGDWDLIRELAKNRSDGRGEEA
jgi:predicted GIY-YIG superfamily endonuclease